MDPHNGQIPVGLIAQLEEECTSIARGQGLSDVQAWPFNPFPPMSANGTYRFYSVKRQTILLVKGEPLGR